MGAEGRREAARWVEGCVAGRVVEAVREKGDQVHCMVGACSLNLAVLERGLGVVRQGYTPGWGRRSTATEVLEGRLVDASKEEIEETKEEEVEEEKVADMEEVVSSLELAVANLDRCLEGLKHDTAHKEVMRGTMEVVQAATRLVACIKKEQNSKS